MWFGHLLRMEDEVKNMWEVKPSEKRESPRQT